MCQANRCGNERASVNWASFPQNVRSAPEFNRSYHGPAACVALRFQYIRTVRRSNDLDSVDRQILALLEEDARRPNSDIARLVELSPVTVAERIGRLRDIGVISKFTIRVDPGRMGFQTAAIVEFEPHSSYHAEGVRVVASHSAVRSCYKVTGRALLILVVRVRNSAELNSVLLEFNEYGTTHTAVVLSSELEDRPWFAPDWADPVQALTRKTRGY